MGHRPHMAGAQGSVGSGSLGLQGEPPTGTWGDWASRSASLRADLTARSGHLPGLSSSGLLPLSGHLDVAGCVEWPVTCFPHTALAVLLCHLACSLNSAALTLSVSSTFGVVSPGASGAALLLLEVLCPFLTIFCVFLRWPNSFLMSPSGCCGWFLPETRSSSAPGSHPSPFLRVPSSPTSSSCVGSPQSSWGGRPLRATRGHPCRVSL